MAGEIIPLNKCLHTDRMHGCENCFYASLGYVKFGVELWFDCKNPAYRGRSYIGSHVCEKHEYQTPCRFKGDIDKALERILQRLTDKAGDTLSKILGKGGE